RTQPRDCGGAESEPKGHSQPVNNLPPMLGSATLQCALHLVSETSLLMRFPRIALNQWQRGDGLLKERSHTAVRLMRGQAAPVHLPSKNLHRHNEQRNCGQRYESEWRVHAPHHCHHERERERGLRKSKHALLKQSLECERVPARAVNQIALARPLVKANGKT